MTKKYSRRIAAVYIDSLIIGFVVAILIELLRKKEWLGDFSSLSACILLVLFIFKDFVFRNAGIGKK